MRLGIETQTGGGKHARAVLCLFPERVIYLDRDRLNVAQSLCTAPQNDVFDTVDIHLQVLGPRQPETRDTLIHGQSDGSKLEDLGHLSTVEPQRRSEAG